MRYFSYFLSRNQACAHCLSSPAPHQVRAKLPGEAFVGGLWPAIWLLGNLARATYVGSSNWIWPWSFDSCDRHLQPKQVGGRGLHALCSRCRVLAVCFRCTSRDRTSKRRSRARSRPLFYRRGQLRCRVGQLISACAPHPHYDFASFTGRGAPEIDILEAMPGKQALPPSKTGRPYFSTSLQVMGPPPAPSSGLGPQLAR